MELLNHDDKHFIDDVSINVILEQADDFARIRLTVRSSDSAFDRDSIRGRTSLKPSFKISNLMIRADSLRVTARIHGLEAVVLRLPKV